MQNKSKNIVNILYTALIVILVIILFNDEPIWLRILVLSFSIAPLVKSICIFFNNISLGDFLYNIFTALGMFNLAGLLSTVAYNAIKIGDYFLLVPIIPMILLFIYGAINLVIKGKN